MIFFIFLIIFFLFNSSIHCVETNVKIDKENEAHPLKIRQKFNLDQMERRHRLRSYISNTHNAFEQDLTNSQSKTIVKIVEHLKRMHCEHVFLDLGANYGLKKLKKKKNDDF